MDGEGWKGRMESEGWKGSMKGNGCQIMEALHYFDPPIEVVFANFLKLV